MVERGLRHAARDVPQGRRALCAKSAAANARSAFATRWVGRSTPSACRYIRAAAIVQLLLGNIGRPGRRHHGAARSRLDSGLDRYPDALRLAARLHQDADARAHETLSSIGEDTQPKPAAGRIVASTTSSACSKPGTATRATAENGWGFDLLPQHHRRPLAPSALLHDDRRRRQGLLLWRPKPGRRLTNAHCNAARWQLKWLVVHDFFETESAAFWLIAEVETGALNRSHSATEVFFLPAASIPRKTAPSPTRCACCSCTRRRWIRQATAVPDWFYVPPGLRIKAKLRDSTDPNDRADPWLTWDYPSEGAAGTSRAPSAVLHEINGCVADRRAVANTLRAQRRRHDGVRLLDLLRLLRRGREPDRAPQAGADGWVAPEWGWAWPANRRRSTIAPRPTPTASPWSERKKYVWWDAEAKSLDRLRRPRLSSTKEPVVPPEGAGGMDAHDGSSPFIMQAYGGLAFRRATASTVRSPRTTSRKSRSLRTRSTDGNQSGPQAWPCARQPLSRARRPGDVVYPFVLTTYRLTEHHTAGGCRAPSASGRVAAGAVLRV